MKSGQTIAGKYRLNQLLGTGGMATVWSATNTFTERQFAIKFMLPDVAKTPEAAQRFLMEAKVSARIDHPNVIEVIDVGQTEDGALFLVMELLHGVSLEHVMRKQQPPMTLYEFLAVMIDVARALAAAHRAGIIHRDLKPTNIFLHKDRGRRRRAEGARLRRQQVLARRRPRPLAHDRGHGARLAALHEPRASDAAISTIDHRTDVFAFGAILFEGLCGFRCFDAPNFNALIVTIATTQPKNIDQFAPHMPASLRALVRDCLITDKTHRIDSFDRIVERLAPILAEVQQSPLRLPVPAKRHGEGHTDPEATSAMPAIIKHSDRPPPPPGPAMKPTPASAAPWAGSLPGYRPTPKPPILLFAIGGAVFASMIIALGLGLVFAKRHRAQVEEDNLRAATTAEAAPSVAAPQPSASSSSDVPVISVDSLPMTKSSKVHTGKLAVDATPQACTIIVDGTARGSTPITSLDLAPGTHTLRCESAGGIAKIVSVSVVEGQTTHHHFSTSP